MENRIPTARAVSDEALRAALNEAGVSTSELSLHTYKKTGSTNSEAIYWGEKHDTGAALFIAEEQTAGRGRLGRSFLSPRGGLYMSLLIRPKGDTVDAVSITARCAVAVCRSVEALTGLSLGIKWVNDIYVKGKKLAGILTQGRVNDDGGLDFAVIGIGINLAGVDLGGELSEIAISTEEAGGRVPDRCALAAEIVKEIFKAEGYESEAEMLSEYRRRSILTNKEVRVITSVEEYSATVRGIDERYRLILERDGERISLSTGEVSVRPRER